MKMPKQVTAWFRIEKTEYGRIFYASGSIKYTNNKLSISINNRRMKCAADNYKIKKMVEQEFDGCGNEPFKYRTSPIFNNIVETDNGLVDILRERTEDLKIAYIEKTKEYAKFMFDKANKLLNMSNKEQYDLYKVPCKVSPHNKDSFQVDWSGNYKEGFRLLSRDISNARSIVDKGYNAYEEKEIKEAEMHYESSLIKLAERLKAKGIVDNFEITSGRVGMNFEVTIKHEKGITRAWTIIAEGLIQRPHYRYLVK